MPDELDFGFLKGQSIDAICFSWQQIQLHFNTDSLVRLAIESSFKLTPHKGKPYESADVLADSVLELHAVLAQTVVSVELRRGTILKLELDNGSILEITSNGPIFEVEYEQSGRRFHFY